MSKLSPAGRRLRAQRAANTRWAFADRDEHATRVREQQLDYYRRVVDPDGALSEPERTKRARNAQRAHMQGLAMKSVAARKRPA